MELSCRFKSLLIRDVIFDWILMLMKVDFLMKVHVHTAMQKSARDVLENSIGAQKDELMLLGH